MNEPSVFNGPEVRGTWRELSSKPILGTIYTNTSDRTEVYYCNASVNTVGLPIYIYVEINGVTFANSNNGTPRWNTGVTFIVPAGSSYNISLSDNTYYNIYKLGETYDNNSIISND